MSGGQRYFEDTHGMSYEDWKFHVKRNEVNSDTPGHDAMAKRMVSAHWASLTEDMALRYIEGILEATPPTHVINSFTTRRWQAEQIYNLVYLGVLPDNRGGT